MYDSFDNDVEMIGACLRRGNSGVFQLKNCQKV